MPQNGPFDNNNPFATTTQNDPAWSLYFTDSSGTKRKVPVKKPAPKGTVVTCTWCDAPRSTMELRTYGDNPQGYFLCSKCLPRTYARCYCLRCGGGVVHLIRQPMGGWTKEILKPIMDLISEIPLKEPKMRDYSEDLPTYNVQWENQ